MGHRRWHTLVILAVILTFLLVACAREVQPEATETPSATATTEAATTEVESEATEVVTQEPEETSTEAVEQEATEVATQEPEEVVTAEVTTQEPEETATEAVESEATEEMATLISADELGLPYTFDYPEDFEAQPDSNTDLVTLTKGDQKVMVVGPASYSDVLDEQGFDSDAEQLTFYLKQAGYDIGEETPMAMGLVSISVAQPDEGQVGVANLIDLENGRRGVVIELGPDEDPVPGNVGAAIMNSIVYPPDVADVVASRDDFSMFVAAVEAAGIDLRSGEITVFVPTNEAFTAALETLGLTTEELLADTETLSAILNYHVVDGKILAEDINGMDGEEIATLNGAMITVAVSDDGVTLTDGRGNVVNVVETDIKASNGVIHVIDGVLLPRIEEAEVTEEPEATSEAATQTILALTIANSDLSTLSTAIVRADLVGELSGEGSYTVFAPTNDAFAATLETLGISADELLSNRDLLTGILTYHVVDGALLSGDLEDGQELATLHGKTLTIGVSDEGVTVTDESGNTYHVVTADITASNGVIHTIDGVLMPSDE